MSHHGAHPLGRTPVLPYTVSETSSLAESNLRAGWETPGVSASTPWQYMLCAQPRNFNLCRGKGWKIHPKAELYGFQLEEEAWMGDWRLRLTKDTWVWLGIFGSLRRRQRGHTGPQPPPNRCHRSYLDSTAGTGHGRAQPWRRTRPPSRRGAPGTEPL